jgi:hypothetical protein
MPSSQNAFDAALNAAAPLVNALQQPSTNGAPVGNSPVYSNVTPQGPSPWPSPSQQWPTPQNGPAAVPNPAPNQGWPQGNVDTAQRPSFPFPQ